MHSGAFAVAVGGLLAVGFFVAPAVADEPEVAPLENGFLIEADPITADDLEEVFTRDVQTQGVVVRYSDGSVTVFERETPPSPSPPPLPQLEVDATGADAAPETMVGAEAAPETMVRAEAAPATGMLTGDDIRTHVVGNTATRFLRGSLRVEYYAPDGKIAGRWRNLPIEGTWAVQDEAMCFDYAGSRRDFCARLSLDEGTVSLYDADGARYGRTLSLLPGNPGNL